MTLNHQTLAKVGQALFGQSWQIDLASALNVHDRTVRRWAKDQFNIPAGVWNDLESLCRARGANLEGIAQAIKLELTEPAQP